MLQVAKTISGNGRIVIKNADFQEGLHNGTVAIPPNVVLSTDSNGALSGSTFTTIPITWAGVWAVPISGSIDYKFLSPETVIMSLGISAFATSDVSNHMISEVNLPAEITPTVERVIPVTIEEGGVMSAGSIFLQTNGVISIRVGGAAPNFFAAAVNVGFYPLTFIYKLTPL